MVKVKGFVKIFLQHPAMTRRQPATSVKTKPNQPCFKRSGTQSVTSLKEVGESGRKDRTGFRCWVRAILARGTGLHPRCVGRSGLRERILP